MLIFVANHIQSYHSFWFIACKYSLYRIMRFDIFFSFSAIGTEQLKCKFTCTFFGGLFLLASIWFGLHICVYKSFMVLMEVVHIIHYYTQSPIMYALVLRHHSSNTPNHTCGTSLGSTVYVPEESKTKQYRNSFPITPSLLLLPLPPGTRIPRLRQIQKRKRERKKEITNRCRLSVLLLNF